MASSSDQVVLPPHQSSTARLLSEQVLPLREAASLAGLTPPPSTKTMLRWAIAGRYGHKLETVRSVGRRLTSVQAVVRFLERLQERPGAPEPAIDSKAAGDVLKGFGLGRE